MLVDPAGERVVSVLDFGDMVYSRHRLQSRGGDRVRHARTAGPDRRRRGRWSDAYRKVRPLSDAEIDALYPLAATRLAMSVCYCAWQSAEAPGNEYLQDQQRAGVDAARATRRAARGLAGRGLSRQPRATCSSAAGAAISDRRSASRYREPLHIIRGWRQNLYDSSGRAYLDCVNNVAHVGHCHPRVVRAAADQMARLNTNTRYLDENLVEYIERLTATLPPPLSVVYLVCSGSEANELALRLARAHTGRDSVVVVETAYHGNTNALIDHLAL